MTTSSVPIVITPISRITIRRASSTCSRRSSASMSPRRPRSRAAPRRRARPRRTIVTTSGASAVEVVQPVGRLASVEPAARRRPDHVAARRSPGRRAGSARTASTGLPRSQRDGTPRRGERVGRERHECETLVDARSESDLPHYVATCHKEGYNPAPPHAAGVPPRSRVLVLGAVFGGLFAVINGILGPRRPNKVKQRAVRVRHPFERHEELPLRDLVLPDRDALHPVRHRGRLSLSGRRAARGVRDVRARRDDHRSSRCCSWRSSYVWRQRSSRMEVIRQPLGGTATATGPRGSASARPPAAARRARGRGPRALRRGARAADDARDGAELGARERGAGRSASASPAARSR